MLHLFNPLRWKIWHRLWRPCSYFFGKFLAVIQRYSDSQGRSVSGVDSEHTAKYETTRLPSSGDKHNIIERTVTIEESDDRRLLRIGIFAEVYLINKTVVRKVPRGESEEDILPILYEATIYNILGNHPRIAECLSHNETKHVDVKFYPHGDLSAYLQNNRAKLTDDLRSKWFEQIIEAIVKIHSHDIIHSDLALRQYFLDNDFNLRLGDFNLSQFPGQPALGFEKASHCLPRNYEAPNTIMSDLFALGSTLYELVAGKAPYQELYPLEPEEVMQSRDHDVIRARIQRQRQVDFEIEKRFKSQIFPDVSCLFGGDVIFRCWKGQFTSAQEAILYYRSLQNV